MPFQCFMAHSKEEQKQVGAMWYDPTEPEVWKALLESDIKQGKTADFSDEYIRDWLGKRSPLMVRLPNGFEFCLDWKASGAGNSGWTVQGEAPNVTVKPSINMFPGKKDGWHGWITNGQISDDLDRR